MLTILLLIPIIGILVILPINNTTRIKEFGLYRAVRNLRLSLLLWAKFDSGSLQYQFVQEFNTLDFCHLHIGIDGISLYFVLLTTFITPLCFLAN